MEYRGDEIVGKLHRAFVDSTYANSAGYSQFWDDLKAGKSHTDVFKRLTKSGQGVWIQATYSPVKDEMDRVVKVVNIATDVTREKLEVVGQLEAISKAQSVVEFSMEGKILAVNDNFQTMFGYSRNEITGQHHNILLDSAYQSSPENRAMWEKLRRGEYDAGQYKYVGKGGKALWIQAFCSPLADLSNKPFKVVMYATDITQQIKATRMLQSAVGETKTVITAAKEGDLAQRVPLEGKTGDIADLCANVNSMVEMTEVRNLAQRSSAAAKEIKLLIGDSVNEVESGTRLVDEAGATMNEIVQSIKHVTDIIGEITAASREQSSGIEQVNDAVTQIDEGTQQNAALVEQAAAAAEEMQTQAQQLTEAVAVFSTSSKSPSASTDASKYVPERRDLETRPFNGKPMSEKETSTVVKAQTTANTCLPGTKVAAAGMGDEWGEF